MTKKVRTSERSLALHAGVRAGFTVAAALQALNRGELLSTALDDEALRIQIADIVTEQLERDLVEGGPEHYTPMILAIIRAFALSTKGRSS